MFCISIYSLLLIDMLSCLASTAAVSRALLSARGMGSVSRTSVRRNSNSSVNNNNNSNSHSSNSNGNATSGGAREGAAGASQDQMRRLKKRGRSTFLTVGVPFIIFMFGGYLFLAEFMKTHVEMKDQRNKTKSIIDYEIEEEYNSMVKGLDTENYRLSAVPRPGESVARKKKPEP